MSNTSSLFVFSLSGFSSTTNFRLTLFSLTLLCYFLILVVNVSIILTIILDENLHEPMYIFLCNLCVNALYGTAGFYPKFAYDLLSDIHNLSFAGCLLQVFILQSYAKVDYSILVLMAYDRYVAICRPLEYRHVMSVRATALLVTLSWLVPLCCETIVIGLTSTLTLCGSQIQKLYCENWSIVKLACSSTSANNIVGMFFIIFYMAHVFFIVCSYLCLVKSALKSMESRRKFLQTCVPHLFCLFNVSAVLLFDVMYSRYGSASLPKSVENFVSIEFIIFPPTFNPVIYGLILTKIRGRIMHLFMMSGQNLRSVWIKVDGKQIKSNIISQSCKRI